MSQSPHAETIATLSAVSAVARSDIGRRREENQDSFGIIENDNFKMYIVADGMGGVKGGAVASGTAIAVLQERLKVARDLNEQVIAHAVHAANEKILSEAHNKPALTGMGTTCVGIAFSGTNLFLVNVGDSRAYRVRQGQISQLTEDHTLVMELLRSGTISPDQAQNHPVSHMLTRSLGPTEDLEVDSWRSSEPPARGDKYLLCSDGLYNLVTEQEMTEILLKQTTEDAATALINLANERGGTDNITVIVIALGDGYPLEAPQVKAEAAKAPTEAVIESTNLNGSSASQHAAEAVHSDVRSESPRDEIAAAIDLDGAHSEIEPQTEVAAASGPGLRTVIGARISLVVAGVLIGGAGVLLASHFWPNEAPSLAAEAGIVGDSTGEAASTDGKNVATAQTVPTAATTPTVQDSKQDALAYSIAQRERLAARRTELLRRVREIDDKLASFDKPLSGSMGALLRDAQANGEQLQKEFEKVRDEIDVATRKLAVWHQRKKKLQEGDPVNLANEVAVSSEKVRAKKDEFERVTWSYLREAEVLVYNPSDAVQSEKVNTLRTERKQKKAELVDEIRAAIETAASGSDQEITELILRRDKLAGQINDGKRDVAFARAIMSDDAQEKKRVREELVHERDLAQEEVESIDLMQKTADLHSP